MPLQQAGSTTCHCTTKMKMNRLVIVAGDTLLITMITEATTGPS
jgi:translation initiation factor IF-1